AAMATLTADFSPYVRRGPDGSSHIDLLVPGVHCANCIAKIEKGLGELDGVSLARVNLSTTRLAVEWNAARTSAARIVTRLAELGFSAKPYEVDTLLGARENEGRELLTGIVIAGAGAVFVSGLTDTTLFGLKDMGPGTLALLRWLSALVAVPVALI